MHYFVTVVGKWVFDSIIFSIPLILDKTEYWYINDNEKN